MKSKTTPGFWKYYRRLPSEIRHQLRLAHWQWLLHPDLPGLRFKQINVQDRIYSVCVNDNYRVLGTREGDVITWYFVGTHDDYIRQLAGH